MIFKDMAVCDLRGYNTAESAGIIKEITDVALVILPKNMDEETKKAFASIKMEDVASTVYADEDCKINIYNGEVILNSGNISGDSIWVINGTAVIMPLPEDAHVSVIVNGQVYNDISNQDSVEFLSVNGTMEIIDTKDAILLLNNENITDEMLCGDTEKKFFSNGDVIIKKVSAHARGYINVVGKIYAHESVKQSQIRLKSNSVIYYNCDGDLIFKKNIGTLHISRAFLQEIDGMLIVKNVGTLVFEKDIEPELFKQKVLEIKNSSKIIAPAKIFDLVQLRSKNIGKIKRKR